MSEDDGGLGAFLAGFVIGGLVGAAVALVLAPQSGEETRHQIAVKGQQLRDSGEEQFAKAGTAMAEARGRFQESSEHLQERARIVLDEGKSKVTKSFTKEGEGVDSETDQTDVNLNATDEEALT